LQFANNAWPVITEQAIHGFGWNCVDGLLHASGKSAHKAPGQ
jgi:hypothetical protein